MGTNPSGARQAEMLELWHELTHFPALQQLDDGSLLSSDVAEIFGHKESCLQRFGEGPARGQAPLPGQGLIPALDFKDVTGDFNTNSLATKRTRQIRAGGAAVAIEADQGGNHGGKIENLTLARL